MTTILLILLWLGYFLVLALAMFIVYQVVKTTEYTTCICRHRIPFVPSSQHLRAAVTKAIQDYYPKTKTVCDIGSGYGGLARTIARQCNARVTALENMPFCALVSHVCDRVTRANNKTVWCDAFQYLATGPRFDVAVAYLGPRINNRVAAMRDRFSVLILLDVPADDIAPTRIIDVGHGATRYGRAHKSYPHKLFIYEFDK